MATSKKSCPVIVPKRSREDDDDDDAEGDAAGDGGGGGHGDILVNALGPSSFLWLLLLLLPRPKLCPFALPKNQLAGCLAG